MLTEVEILSGLLLGDDGIGGGSFLSVLENADPEWNPETTSVIPAGATHPYYGSVIGETLGVPFQCGQLADLIPLLGNFGADVATMRLFYRLVASEDGVAPIDITETDPLAQVHTLFTATKAIAYMQSITAGDRAQAFVNGRVSPLKDGVNEALIRSGSAHITRAPVADQYYSLGSVVYKDNVGGGGIVIEGCDGMNINLSPTLRELSSESNKDIEHTSVRTIVPAVEFTATDRDVFDLRNTEVNNFKVHLLRGKNASDQYLTTEAQHIRATIKKGLFFVTGKDSGDESRYTCRIEALGDLASGWDSDPIQWDVNVVVDNT